jgi:hypothetical protein
MKGMIDSGELESAANIDTLVEGAVEEILAQGSATKRQPRVPPAGDEFAAPLADSRDIDLVPGRFGNQRREPAVPNAFTDSVGIDDRVEQPVFALIEAARIEPVWRSRKPANAHAALEPAQPGNSRCVHGIVAAGNQVRFIDNEQIAGTERLRIAIDALHAADDNRCIYTTCTERRAIDAYWSLGPHRQDCPCILLDDFPNVTEDYDSPLILPEPAAKLGNQKTLAEPRREIDHRIAASGAPKIPERREGFNLVRPQDERRGHAIARSSVVRASEVRSLACGFSGRDGTVGIVTGASPPVDRVGHLALSPFSPV